MKLMLRDRLNIIIIDLLPLHLHSLTTITNRSRQRHFFNVHMALTTTHKHGNKIEM